MTRDRDPAGRPRNARPRDALGRPLDRFDGSESDSESGSGSFFWIWLWRGPDVPTTSRWPGRTRPGWPTKCCAPDARSTRTRSSRRRGKPARPTERDLWQGLAQVAVGLTHARRGNARGAVALLSRGAQRVRAYQAAVPSPAGPYGMDLTAFLAASDDLAARIERDGLADIPDAALRPGLRAL